MTARLFKILAFVFSVELIGCGFRFGDVVLLQSGFEGWVTVHYEVAGAPTLLRTYGKFIIQIPPSGSIATRSRRQRGYGIDEYYWVQEGGERIRIRSEGMSCSEDEPCVQQFQYYSAPAIVTKFFVGRRRDISRYPSPEIK